MDIKSSADIRSFVNIRSFTDIKSLVDVGSLVKVKYCSTSLCILVLSLVFILGFKL